jgi:hypothetical protein
MLGAQLAGYYLTRPLLPYLTPRILTGPLDARIPFCPPWITVYYLSYVFWIGTGLWILLEDRDQHDRDRVDRQRIIQQEQEDVQDSQGSHSHNGAGSLLGCCFGF